ncbi:undecaprenyldiphospho-muramoylpentapeptide beta-N-acetylglucosaminyltransferase [Caminibacter pacificus]|uniref:UDP-N-acetylglucosamine--N-acetylmuramyl-(pentapeptide) pyrophosphoryl-undecaprenol N-acetylglucosamine transferase n=1 Tax=Caminibacter pacificus TaxID=1424653 RepID=A0AAJ4RBW7_9BACT|nr:undecaprenyldiphospho-muramoylpentapeptide beta-N-acetylglucosaminyltransferase [Caminibacter pacificus]QCI29075.1 undecaprenyldiphospho-muramoylpentapeptide beta-N-acetylglucosaminyltransferase [Caminibacter pacificus]ROR39106.1 UDP-N-acetylglucosamine-N-acetylmuramylpentapeptide N-acetylglucosamine transferase [Caminibacter pacificus]
MNILITGGGTGGHLKIAKVIKEELNKKGIKPIYVGSTKGADKEWFAQDEGFSEKYFLDSSGVVNKKGLGKINSLSNIIKLSFEAKKIIKKHNVKAVFSVGGYSAAPASFGAIFSNTPLFIHEQNAHIGSLNKILKPFSKKFFNTFLYNDPYPVEDKFFERARIRKELKTIIFLGGSQGAVAINDFAIRIAPLLKQKNIKIIHQSGKRDFERVKNFYEKNSIEADVFDFDKNLIEKIEKADFAISRAGASTLFELAANQIPTLFVPYPYAAGDHQYHNAKFLADKNAALVIRQNELKIEILDKILNLNLEEMSKNLKNVNKKEGAKYIADRILI